MHPITPGSIPQRDAPEHSPLEACLRDLEGLHYLCKDGWLIHSNGGAVKSKSVSQLNHIIFKRNGVLLLSNAKMDITK